jgi:hypothetical protein
MSRFDDLPADQKAVLQLLLKQNKSYEDLSTLLRITPEAVRDRALLALDGLGPEDTPGLDDDRRDEIGDYLLGQQPASERAATRSFLEGSAPGRAYARVVAGELRSVGGDALPDIPAEGAEIDEAFDALSARKRAREDRQKSSRLGGFLVLGGVAAALAVVIILLLSGGDDDDGDPVAGTNTATQSTAAPEIQEQINLTAGVKGSKARGVVLLLEQDGQRVYAFRADNLGVASPRYAVWMYNSASSHKFLGFAPPVTGSGEQKGRLTAVTAVPGDASKFKELVITREQVDKPTKPGLIVLRGPISGGGTQ